MPKNNQSVYNRRIILAVFANIVFVLTIFSHIRSISTVFAADTPTPTPSISDPAKTAAAQDIASKIKEYQDKINQLSGTASSLKREIDIVQNNIDLKTAQIQQAEAQIVQKEDELNQVQESIKLMEVRLNRLDGTIDYHEKLLESRLKEEYISRQQSFLEVLMSANGIGDFVSKLTYLRKIQEEDKNLLSKMNDTKGNYEDQQNLLQDKKNEVEKIKADIENKRNEAAKLKDSLEQQKEEKDNLLSVTKNDEKKYQELLDSAKKELSQIQSAAGVVVRGGKPVDVKEGEVIGTMGNSGHSSGAHLHFSIYSYTEADFNKESGYQWYYNNYENPLKYLKPMEIAWSTGCFRDLKGLNTSGEGSWSWPMSNIRVTQSFGSQTCYNWMYGGKPHPALDMVAVGDISIRAVKAGKAYFCRNCLRDGANGVFIFHEGGKMSVYWHLK